MKRKIIAMLMAAVLLLGLLPFGTVAFALEKVTVNSNNDSADARYFEVSQTSGWEELKAPHHYVGTEDTKANTAYCLEQTQASPHGAEYDQIDYDTAIAEDAYSDYVLEGLYIILSNGYPATNGGFSDDQARYATAVALHCWLAENGDPYHPYNYMNRKDRPGAMRAKSGHDALLDWTDSLLEKARKGETRSSTVTISPDTLELTPDGNFFTGKVKVTTVNCSDGYEVSAVSITQIQNLGGTITGTTGNSGDYITIKLPKSAANKKLSLVVNGLDDKTTASMYILRSDVSGVQGTMAYWKLDLVAPVGMDGITLTTPANGTLTIEKTDADTGASLSSARFKITTDEAGKNAVKTNVAPGTKVELEAGIYYIHETTVPSGYLPLSAPVKVTITAGQDSEKTIENTAQTGKIRVRKTNADTGLTGAAADSSLYSLAGAEFEIRNSKGALVDTLVTASNGYTEYSKALPLGKYTVKEKKASPGYLVNPKSFSVTLSHDSSVTTVQATSTVPETPQSGKIRVRKTNADTGLTGAAADSSLYSLKGAVFEVRNGKNVVVDTLTTGEDGYTEYSKELPLGKYTVKEKKASPGYLINPQAYTVSLNYDSSVTTVQATGTVPETPQSGKIRVRKTNADTGLTGAAADSSLYSLAGAEFEIRNSKGALVDTLVTASNGYTGYSKELPLGKYTVKEKKASPGFVLNQKEFSVTLAYDAGADEVAQTVTVPETPKELYITVVKEDAETGDTPQGDGTLLGGVFEIYDGDGKLVETLTMDAGTNQAKSKRLPIGQYTIKEKTPPEGYLPATDIIVVNLTGAETGDQTTVTFEKTATVKNTVMKAPVSIIKWKEDTPEGDNSTGVKEPEEGAEFQIYLKAAGSYEKAKESERDLLITNEYGAAKSKSLPYGVYTVVQTKGQAGYDLVPPFDVVIDQERDEDHPIQYLAENAAITRRIKVQKVDRETGRVIPLSGAKFKIWNVDKQEWVSQQMYYPAFQTVTEWVTDDEGGFELINGIYGHFQLIEVESPWGYLLDGQPLDLDITETNPDFASGHTISITFSDAPAKGRIRIDKTGDVFRGIEQTETEYGTVYEAMFGQGSIEGAVFEIAAKEDIVTPDGTVRARAGEVVDTITTSADGENLSKPLYLGKYIIREVAVPEGYVAEVREYEAELTYEGETVPVTETAVTAVNRWQEAAASVKKEAEILRTVETENRIRTKVETVPGEGFVFGLYAKNGFGADGMELTQDAEADDAVMPKDGLAAVGITDSAGNVSFQGKLLHGEYYLKEIAAPEGYVLDTEAYPVDLRYDADKKEITVEPVNVLNHLDREDITITKTDITGENTLPGAVIEIYDDKGALVYQEATDENGEIPDIPVMKGKEYTLKETLAPNGYALNTSVMHFRVTSDGDIIGETTIKDELTELKVRKVDSTGKPLAGAAFGLFDKDGRLVMEAVSGSDGLAVFRGFAFGEYQVRETKAPAGYQLSEGTLSFLCDGSYTNTGEIYEIENKRLVLIKIRKTDAQDGRPLAGAEIQVMDETGKVLYTGVTDEAGQLDILELTEGSYQYEEIKAPSGYLLDKEKHMFTIQPGGTVEGSLILENMPVKVLLKKVNEKNQPLKGAVFGLFDKEGRLLMESESGDDGMVCFQRVPVGTYVIRETDAPDGYMLSKEEIHVTVEENHVNSDTPAAVVKNLPEKVVIVQTGVQEGDGLMIAAAVGVILLAAAAAVRLKRRRSKAK